MTTPGALSREQVEQMLSGGVFEIVSVLDTDAALRATIAQQAQEIESAHELNRVAAMALSEKAQEIERLTGDVKDQKAKQAACVAELAARTQERDEAMGYAASMSNDVTHLGEQLAAAQARVKELESKQIIPCLPAHALELQQLQATLTAREERIQHLEGVLKFVGVSEDADSIIMDMKKYHASHRCELHRADPWQGIDVEQTCFVCLKVERDSAHQDAARLREALSQHWVTAVDCNHAERTDTVRCSCSVWTGTPQPSVGQAIDEWVTHVYEQAHRALKGGV